MTTMKRVAALAVLSLLSSCTDRQFGAHFGFGSEGVSFTPSLSGQIGGAKITASG